MLEMILDRQILLISMGGAAALGVLSKCIVNVSLKRLVKAAGNMNKSTHPFMRLVRAKFEHACMISDTVQNVGVFVDKYMYEYKVFGIRLHTWRRMETGMAWLCLIFGILASGAEYTVYGMNDLVIRYGAMGAIMGVLLFLFHLTTDEKYQLEAAKNYMVDYLENVCAHRYTKMYKKDLQVMAPPETEDLTEDENEDEDVEEDEEYREYETFGQGIKFMEDEEEADEVISKIKEPDIKVSEMKAELKAAEEPEEAEEMETEGEMAAVKAVRQAAGKSYAVHRRTGKGGNIKSASPEDPGRKKKTQGDPDYPHPREEVPSPSASPEIKPPAMPEPIPVPQVQAMEEKEEKKGLSKEVLIREILEEFLA